MTINRKFCDKGRQGYEKMALMDKQSSIKL